MENAKIKYESLIRTKDNADVFALKIMKELGLKKPVYSIECYDISHTKGIDMVGAKVLFRDLKPDKQHYRRYNIKMTEGIDDYKCLYEVLTRRIKRGIKESDLPDLFLIDGGLGQLSVLERVLHENNLALQGAAVAKESHSKSSKDRVFVMGRKNYVPLGDANPVMLKIKQIRDEAHRFAISFHKLKRDKRIFK